MLLILLKHNNIKIIHIPWLSNVIDTFKVHGYYTYDNRLGYFFKYKEYELKILSRKLLVDTTVDDIETVYQNVKNFIHSNYYEVYSGRDIGELVGTITDAKIIGLSFEIEKCLLKNGDIYAASFNNENFCSHCEEYFREYKSTKIIQIGTRLPEDTDNYISILDYLNNYSKYELARKFIELQIGVQTSCTDCLTYKLTMNGETFYCCSCSSVIKNLHDILIDNKCPNYIKSLECKDIRVYSFKSLEQIVSKYIKEESNQSSSKKRVVNFLTKILVQ